MKRTALFAAILLASAAPVFAQTMSGSTVRVGSQAMFPSKTVVAGSYDTNKHRALILEGNGTAKLNIVSGGKPWLMMNSSSNIVISDVRQSNGVIQVVDHVLHPRA